MDIHPPQHPITSVRAFLLEIFTVTCGILIAMTLENVASDRRARHLRDETRADFLAEVSANRSAIEQHLGASTAEQALLKSLLAYGTRTLAHQPVPAVPSLPGRDFTPLTSDAWQTALATQGIGQMDHATARALSAAYDTQMAFNSLQERALGEWLAFAAYSDMQAGRAEDLRLALQHLRVSYDLAASLRSVASTLDRQYVVAERALRRST